MPRAGWVASGAVIVALAAAAGRALGVGGAVGALACATVAAAVVVVGRRRPGASTAALVAGMALVIVRVLADPGTGPGGVSPVATRVPTGSAWVGTVVSIGSPREGQQVATLDLAPGPGDVGATGRSEPGPGDGSPVRVTATLPRYPPIRPGLVVAVHGAVEPLPDDDYGHYLASADIEGIVRSRDLRVVGIDDGPAATLEGMRRAGDDALTRALPEPEAGLAAGILIGLRDRVDRDLAAAFTAAGVSHVVAISGWNIAIVGATVAALLRSRPRRQRAFVTLAAIGCYTVLTGASASVLRAAAMATVVLVARETGRAGHAAAALGWAVAGLLVAGPTLVTDPGFALSAAATGGLIAWGTPLTRRFAAWRGGRLPGWLAESLGVSLAAEFATLPIALAWFGRVPIVAPAVNLLVVPLVAPAMAAGGLALVGGAAGALGAPGVVATVAGLPAWAVLSAMVVVVRGAAALPFASMTLQPPVNLLAAVIAAAAIGLVVVGRRPGGLGRWISTLRRWRRSHRSFRRPPDPRRPPTAGRGGTTPSNPGRKTRPARRSTRRAARVAAAVLGASIVAVIAVAATRPDGRLRITVLDVGQGDAILVDGDRGARMLVDGGPDPDRLLVALDAHVPAWDRRIDLLVLTHPHEDHVAGLALLMERYRVSRVVEPGMRGPGPGYRAWADELAREGRSAGRLSTGDTFAFDDVGFRVLWPDRDAVPAQPSDTGTGINNVSIVLLGTFGNERFILAGDIEEGIDPILLSRGLPRVDVLKVAHHGSRTSSTEAFLDAVQPRIAAVSVGAGNPYGHPAPATITRLRDHHAQVFRTDTDGTVDITLDGASPTAKAEGARRRAEVPSGPAAGTALAAAFRCGIPDPAPAVAGPPPARGPIGVYDRRDDDPRAGRRRSPPPDARPAAVGPAPRPGRG